MVDIQRNCEDVVHGLINITILVVLGNGIIISTAIFFDMASCIEFVRF